MTTAADASCPHVRYIKLGPANAWAERALSNGELHLGHSEVPHDLALAGDAAAIVAHLTAQGRAPGKARDFAREILDFYRLSPETLWITFAKGRLWWGRAETWVSWLGEGAGHGARTRRVIGGWSDSDAKGQPLITSRLSTRLTKVGAYRQTICAVGAADYLRSKLAGEATPAVDRTVAALGEVQAAAEELIAGLHWADFETLVELLLTRGGWHRVSALGGTQADVDLVVEQPLTGESAFVQVKSVASQAVFDDYLARFDSNPAFTRMIFACHTPRGEINTGGRTDVTLLARRGLAEAAVRAGLLDWLIARAA